MAFSIEKIYLDLQTRSDAIAAEGRRLFDCPEPGFREYQTADMICARLDQMGIAYERDVARTGVIARIGHGDYHIAVVADIDALPRRDGNGFIHSCGHSIQTANALTLLEVLVPFEQDPDFNGRVSVFFTPAEELTDPEYRKTLMQQGEVLAISGKQHMIAAGLFDDVDCVLSCHASGDPARTFNINSVLTGFLTKRVVFEGKASHSGAAPHLGRNAQNGAILAMQGISFLKDQFALEDGVCIHPVISSINGGINIIPDRAVLETYIRALSNDSLRTASEKFDNCVTKCAQALGLTAKVETIPGYMPLRQNKSLNRTLETVMLELVDEAHLIHDPISGASGDIGDLGYLLPCIQFGFSGIKGNFHTDDFEVEDEDFCYIQAAKAMTGLVIRLLTDPDTRVYAAEYSAKKAAYLSEWLGRRHS